jgi:hypothetical protein
VSPAATAAGDFHAAFARKAQFRKLRDYFRAFLEYPLEVADYAELVPVKNRRCGRTQGRHRESSSVMLYERAIHSTGKWRPSFSKSRSEVTSVA